MKICHLITRLIIGGAQENTLFTCYGLNERGHRVTLLTGPPLGPEGSLLEEARDRKLLELELDEKSGSYIIKTVIHEE